MVTRIVKVLAGLVACMPGASAIIAWRDGWVPVSDWAVPVVLAWDTFGAHTRLIGQWTSLTRSANTNLYQPGPLQFWLLAIPERIFAPSSFGPLIGSALVSTAAVVVLLVVAWRRGGTRMLAATTLVAALLLHAFGAQILRDPYNPSIAVVCFIGYLAAAWAILEDDRWFWPVAVLFGSISAQTHVTLLVPISTVGLVMVVATVRNVRAARPGARWRRVAATSFVIALVGWSAPLLNQFFGSGNLFALVSSGTSNRARSAGFASAIRRLLEQLMVPPNWLWKAFVPGKDHQLPMGVWPIVSAIIVGLLIILGVWRAIRRRDTAMSSLGIVAIAAACGAVVSSSKLPIDGYASLASTNRFFWWPIGALLWLVLGLTIVEFIASHIRKRSWSPSPLGADRALVGVTAALVLVCSGLLVANASPANDPASSTYGEVQTFRKATASLCKTAPGPVAVSGDLIAQSSAVGGMAAMLSMAGCEVHVTDGVYYGFWRVIDGTEPVELYISGQTEPSEGFRRLASYDGANPPSRYRNYTNIGLFMDLRKVHIDLRVNK